MSSQTPSHPPTGPRPARVPALLLATAVLAGCAAHPRQPVYSPQGRAPVAAAPLYFYPEQGQPDALQDRDRYECYRWASAQTGTDPGLTPVRQPAPPAAVPVQRDGAEIAAATVTGAALGGVLASPGKMGDRAAAGAVLGFIIGAIAQESRAQAAEQYNARRAQQYSQAAAAAGVPHDNFRRAMTACMQGRGYRVA